MYTIKSFLHLLLRIFFTLSATTTVWIISFTALQQTFWMSSLLAIIAGGATYFSVKWFTERKFLKQNKLTKREYIYIKRNLEEAKKKINRLQRVFLQIRSLHNFRQMLTIHRIVKRIYKTVKKEPRRFFQAENFFFYHLDSVVELSEKYAFLINQPVKDKKMYQSLRDTRKTIEKLSKSIEEDLYHILSSDIDHLEFELDVAKHSLKNLERPLMDDERSGKQNE